MAIARSLRIAVFCILASSAHGARDPAASAEELKALRAKIERLQADIAAAEKSRDDALDQLKGSEKAVSEAHRALFQIGRRGSRWRSRAACASPSFASLRRARTARATPRRAPRS